MDTGFPSPSFQVDAVGQKPRGRLASPLGVRQSPSWPPYPSPKKADCPLPGVGGALEGPLHLTHLWGARGVCTNRLTSSRTSQLGQRSLVLMLGGLFASPLQTATVCQPVSSKPTNTGTWENDRLQRKGNHRSHLPADLLLVHVPGRSLRSLCGVGEASAWMQSGPSASALSDGHQRAGTLGSGARTAS